MGQVVEADILGDEWKGYMLRIAGGNDKQGFPMKQGVLTHGKYIAMVINFFYFRKLINIFSIFRRPCTFVVEEGTLMLPSPSYW